MNTHNSHTSESDDAPNAASSKRRINRRAALWLMLAALLNGPLIFTVWRHSRREKELSFEIDGPFERRDSVDMIENNGGNVISTGLSGYPLKISDSRIASVRRVDVSVMDRAFDVTIMFVFAGKPSERLINATVELFDADGKTIASKSRITRDARLNEGNSYFGFYNRPIHKNFATFNFDYLDVSRPVSRIKVTLENLS